MNDNEYLMKNYGVEIEEGVILRVPRPRRITPSEIISSPLQVNAPLTEKTWGRG